MLLAVSRLGNGAVFSHGIASFIAAINLNKLTSECRTQVLAPSLTFLLYFLPRFIYFLHMKVSA
jgi:hypothetical protein